MEEINMFEIHLDPAQKLFKRNNFDEPEFSETYTFFCGNKIVVGDLIAYDAEDITVGNVWITSANEDDGSYQDIITLKIADITKINTQQEFEFDVGSPYRAELYIRNEDKDRPTTWVSCYYRGVTHSGKIMIAIIGRKAKTMLLNKSDIKGFFQLSLDDAKAMAESEEE